MHKGIEKSKQTISGHGGETKKSGFCFDLL